MLDPYIGEIQWVPYTFAPVGWMSCEGQTLAISEYQLLFVLIGTIYGGDGQTTFRLPDLRGRVAVGANPLGTGGLTSRQIGQSGGAESHRLTVNEMPAHTHAYQVTDQRGTTGDPGPNGVAFASGEQAYTSVAQANAVAGPGTIATAGNTQPHLNMQPYQTLNAIIAVTGVFPSRG